MTKKVRTKNLDILLTKEVFMQGVFYLFMQRKGEKKCFILVSTETIK